MVSTVVFRLRGLMGALMMLLASGRCVYAQSEYLSPLSFTSVIELTGGDSGRHITTFDPLVNARSRIVLRFKVDTLAAKEEANGARVAFLESTDLRALTGERTNLLKERDLLRSAVSAPDSARALLSDLREKIGSVEKELALLREAQELGWPAYEITVEARVIPRQGQPFDMPVSGYTTVREEIQEQPGKEAENESALDGGSATIERRTITTSVETRFFRLVCDSDACEKLEISTNTVQNAVVDLSAADLKEGDRVRVTVTNHSPVLSSLTWEFEIRNMGVRRNESPTVLFIKRTDSPSGQNQLESNFKPAPGVSLLFGYTSRSRFWNWLGLEIGINGSFVDFVDNQSLEVGVGPAVSLLGGSIQATIGWNLNVDAGRFYWSLGFGFLDIAAQISN